MLLEEQSKEISLKYSELILCLLKEAKQDNKLWSTRTTTFSKVNVVNFNNGG